MSAPKDYHQLEGSEPWHPRVERRRFKSNGHSPADTLAEMPAPVILERLPVPMLAVGSDGTILLANAAFAAMLGRTQDTIRKSSFDTIFHNLPNHESVCTLMRAYADELVELAHRDGSTVRARMSKSVLVRADDNIVLATFQDLTEQLWLHGR